MEGRFRIWVIVAACGLALAGNAGAQDAEQQLGDLRRATPEQAVQTEAAARRLLADAPTPRIARRTTQVLANAIAHQGRCAEAAPAARRAAEAPSASVFDRRFALAMVYECDDYNGASELLLDLHLRHPEEIADIDAPLIHRTAPLTGNAALLAFIVEGGWTPDDPATDMSDLRLALMRAYLAAGDEAAAIAAARRFAETGSSDLGGIVLLLSDRTFEPILNSDPTGFAFLPLVNRFVDNGFALYAQHPDSLSTLNMLARTLETLNRSTEALALVDDALARTADFSDRDDQLNWTYQTRATLRTRLGLEGALDDLTQGAALGESGRSVNVSQRLNRAGFLLRNEPEQALAQAQEVRPIDLSPYGRSVRRFVIVCANAILSRTDDMRTVLAEARANASDSYRNLQTAAQCANETDVATDAFLHRLQSTAERRGAILDLQGFAGKSPPQQWQQTHSIYGRADVSAAIEREMHIRSYPISRPY